MGLGYHRKAGGSSPQSLGSVLLPLLLLPNFLFPASSSDMVINNTRLASVWSIGDPEESEGTGQSWFLLLGQGVMGFRLLRGILFFHFFPLGSKVVKAEMIRVGLGRPGLGWCRVPPARNCLRLLQVPGPKE